MLATRTVALWLENSPPQVPLLLPLALWWGLLLPHEQQGQGDAGVGPGVQVGYSYYYY